jgi:hypothetical protein
LKDTKINWQNDKGHTERKSQINLASN